MRNPNNPSGADTAAELSHESPLHRIVTSKTAGILGISAIAGSFAAGMATMPHHKVDTVVRQDVLAMEQFVNQSTPAMLESGTKLTAECRRPDGTLMVSESDAAIYTLYTIDPNMLQPANDPHAATSAWIGKIANCG